jgi:hypothetical protein
MTVGVNLDDEQASSIGTGEIDALRSEQLESTRKLVRPIHPNLDKVRTRWPPPLRRLKHLRRPSTSCERAPAFLPGLPRHAMPCALYSGLPISVQSDFLHARAADVQAVYKLIWPPP